MTLAQTISPSATSSGFPEPVWAEIGTLSGQYLERWTRTVLLSPLHLFLNTVMRDILTSISRTTLNSSKGRQTNRGPARALLNGIFDDPVPIVAESQNPEVVQNDSYGLAIAPSKPDAPANLSFSLSGNNVELSWKNPPLTGGSKITEVYRASSSTGWTELARVSGPADSDNAPAKLKAGKNALLVMVSQRAGGWDFGVRLSRADGTVPEFKVIQPQP